MARKAKKTVKKSHVQAKRARHVHDGNFIIIVGGGLVVLMLLFFLFGQMKSSNPTVVNAETTQEAMEDGVYSSDGE